MKRIKRNVKYIIRFLLYYLQHPRYVFVYKYYKSKMPEIKSSVETLDYILEFKVSVSRYGDGELNLIKGIGNGFCSPDNWLASRLDEILRSDLKNHIVCIPYALKTLKPYTWCAACFWEVHLYHRLGAWVSRLKKNKIYYDTLMTRFYMDYKSKKGCSELIGKLRLLWQDRAILIVEGELSRLGVGNDLFDNAATVHRILCPAKDAYKQYDRILKTAGEHGKDKLILIALGQTATVLAYDLAVLGYQAIDIGHLDVEYEWYLRKMKFKEAIPGKFVNEAGNNQYLPIDPCRQIKYNSQVITRI